MVNLALAGQLNKNLVAAPQNLDAEAQREKEVCVL